MASNGLAGWLAGVALLAGTAVAMADGSKPAAAGVGFALSGTSGIVAFGLPAGDSGVRASGGAGPNAAGAGMNAVGYQNSISGSVDLGSYDGASFSLGVVGFGAFASGSSSTATSFSGAGTVVVPSYAAPPGTINLTAGGGTAQAIVTAPGLAAASSSVSIGSCCQDALDAEQNFSGRTFSLAAASANATTGAAYGVVAGPDGGIFIGRGDLTGLEVTTTQAQALTYAGADIALSVSGTVGGNKVLQAYAGPSYRYLGQRETSLTAVSMPALSMGGGGLPLALPVYSDQRIEDIVSNYFGAAGGLNLTAPVSANAAVTLGGSLGLYALNASGTGSESYALGGGAGSAGGTVLPLPSQTLGKAARQSFAAGSSAYSAGLNSVVTVSLTRNLAISFAGSLEYVSAVPVTSHPAPVLVNISADSVAYGGSTGPAPSIGFAGMMNYGANVSLTGHF